MTIFCVVPVHNRIDMTLQFLDSLDKQTVQEPISIIIVDDGSTDGTSETLRKRPNHFPVQVLVGNGNWWWGGCVWRAIQQIKSIAQPKDWVFLANNDTILDPDYLAHLHETAANNERSVVGGRSFEIWPDGTRHPVSSGFLIDDASLWVLAVDGKTNEIREVDALSGRGILLPYEALARTTMHPRWMPQHFADLNLTSQLKAQGFTLLIDHRADSLEIDRASSALELGQHNSLSFNKASPLYIPALATFWWLRTSPIQRPTLPMKALRRLRGKDGPI